MKVIINIPFFIILQYNDIAILTLDQPVTFSKAIRPVCLPAGSRAYAGQMATVIGWGSLRESKYLLNHEHLGYICVCPGDYEPFVNLIKATMRHICGLEYLNTCGEFWKIDIIHSILYLFGALIQYGRIRI